MNLHSDMPTVYVKMLGDFSITIGEKQITDADSQSKKPWVLLKYLITFRNRNVMPDELIQLIWGDEESSNPSGALKTLMFRVRKLLDPLEYSGHDLIKQQRKTYVWNPLINTEVDTDVFEKLYHQIYSDEEPLSEEKKLELCLRALEIYKGDFLPRSNWDSWVIPISNYYHSLYLEIVYTTIGLLDKQDNQNMIAGICRRAIAIEPFDEDLHYTLIMALHKSGDHKGAVEHYTDTTDLFYKKFAITPSDHFRSLYPIIHDEKHDITQDMAEIQNILNADHDEAGALFCEYAVFKYVYQMTRRSLSRNGGTVFLCVITVTDSRGDQLRPLLLTRAVEALQYSIQVSLRRSDIYCRYSTCQFAILLSSTTGENAEMVAKRIEKRFRTEYTRKDLSVVCRVQGVPSK